MSACVSHSSLRCCELLRCGCIATPGDFVNESKSDNFLETLSPWYVLKRQTCASLVPGLIQNRAMDQGEGKL